MKLERLFCNTLADILWQVLAGDVEDAGASGGHCGGILTSLRSLPQGQIALYVAIWLSSALLTLSGMYLALAASITILAVTLVIHQQQLSKKG